MDLWLSMKTHSILGRARLKVYSSMAKGKSGEELPQRYRLLISLLFDLFWLQKSMLLMYSFELLETWRNHKLESSTQVRILNIQLSRNPVLFHEWYAHHNKVGMCQYQRRQSHDYHLACSNSPNMCKYMSWSHFQFDYNYRSTQRMLSWNKWSMSYWFFQLS